MPGRPCEVREEARHSPGCALQQTESFPENLGPRRRTRMAKLEEVLARHLVRRAPLLHVAGNQGLQEAHPAAPVEEPRPHAERPPPRHPPPTRPHSLETPE